MASVFDTVNDCLSINEMKTKSKTQKPSEQRSAKGIAKRAADKRRKMEQRDSRKKDGEQVKEAEVKGAVVNDGIQLIVPQAADSERPVVNEDDQKRIVNHPLRDNELIEGEEK
jgi:hypothetical protein